MVTAGVELLLKHKTFVSKMYEESVKTGSLFYLSFIQSVDAVGSSIHTVSLSEEEPIQPPPFCRRLCIFHWCFPFE